MLYTKQNTEKTYQSKRVFELLEETARVKSDLRACRDKDKIKTLNTKHNELIEKNLWNGYIEKDVDLFFSMTDQTYVKIDRRLGSREVISRDAYVTKTVKGFSRGNFEKVEETLPVYNEYFSPVLPERFTHIQSNQNFINTFQPTKYMLYSDAKNDEVNARIQEQIDWEKYPAIDTVFTNVLGEHKDAFVHWLAFIVSERTVSGHAWILKGIQGTGKGTIFNNIIRELLGTHSYQAKAKDLMGFTGWQINKLFINIDEMPKKSKDDVSEVIRNLVTEPFVSLEKKGKDQTEHENFANVLITTNNDKVVDISESDRRYTIIEATVPLKDSLGDLCHRVSYLVKMIKDEAEDFCFHIASLKFDEEIARTAIKTKEKTKETIENMNMLKRIEVSYRMSDFEYLEEVGMEIAECNFAFDYNVFMSDIRLGLINSENKRFILNYYYERSENRVQNKIWRTSFSNPKAISVKRNGNVAKYTSLKV